MDIAPGQQKQPGFPGTDPADRLIVALDFPSAEMALELVDQLQGVCRWFKVGMELYYAAGNAVVERLRDRGYKIFLDLKLHDIPNTVAGAVRTVSATGASLVTVHAAGGPKMLRAAAEAASKPDSPRLLAVTVLTSMDAPELQSVGVSDPTEGSGVVGGQVLRLAKLAASAGITGLVCSAEEVGLLRQALGPDILLVVPGIRPAGSAGRDDQSRVATAAEAIRSGASMLVVGRPITRAADPRAAAEALLEEIRQGAAKN